MRQSSTKNQNKSGFGKTLEIGLWTAATAITLYAVYRAVHTSIRKAKTIKDTLMEIKVPDLGVEQAEVSEIMVKVGDVIAVDDNLVLLESDKASVEVPATAAGKITAISINVGDQVKEGDVILSVESADSAAPSAQPVSAPVQSEAPAPQAAPVATQAQVVPAATSAVSEQTYPLPDLGVDTAEISEWMVKVGDTVTAEQPLVLVESDKASVEVPAPASGKIVKLLVNAGDTVSNSQDFIIIATGDASGAVSEPAVAPVQAETTNAQPAAPVAAQAPTAPVSSGPVTYPLPDLGVDTAEISEWMVKEGDTVTAEQPLVLVESDKASVEVPAPATGKIVKLLVQAGDTVSNGQDFIVIESNDVSVTSSAPMAQASPTQPVTKAATSVAAPTQSTSQPIKAATGQASSNLTEAQINASHANVYAGPAVRKLTRQLGVDIGQVQGTGDKGRVVKDDVFAYVKQRMQTIATAPAASAAPAITATRASLPNLPDMSKTELWGEIEREPLTRLQKVSIPQLNYNTYLPQVTQFDLSDITDTEQMRSDLKDQMKKEGVSLTILAFIMKATAYALMQYPKFNSHLSDDNSEIIIRKTVNLGFAVATDDGLTVPVIRNVQTKGIKQLAQEIGELAKKARDKKLGVQELTGASFTISSQGNLGGTYFTPLVNWPQVAILGVSESTMQPRWNAATKSFEPRLMLPLSLSYDHRVINGADAAVFTRYIATLLADPRRILL